jgi:hypothetical protein
MDPKQAKLKVGVQKFLQKKEQEERKLKEEALRKKKMLLDLRNQDRKATSRVRKMLNMTKSANKSCILDAAESLNDESSAQGMCFNKSYEYGDNDRLLDGEFTITRTIRTKSK